MDYILFCYYLDSISRRFGNVMVSVVTEQIEMLDVLMS